MKSTKNGGCAWSMSWPQDGNKREAGGAAGGDGKGGDPSGRADLEVSGGDLRGRGPVRERSRAGAEDRGARAGGE